jgi:hypothetical protein
MIRSLLLVPMIAFVACRPPGGNASAIEQACASRAQAQCQKRAQCTGGVGIVRIFGDMETCLQRTQLTCTMGLKASDTGNSAALVEQCAAAHLDQSCADFLNGILPPPCAPTGRRPNGGVCAFNGQCQSGYCGGTRTAVCGACKAPPAPDDSCAVDNCAPGQLCVPSTLRCQPYGAVGDACDSLHPCGADLGCTGLTSPVCQPAIATVGARCDADHICDGAVGLHCESHSGMPACTVNVVVGDGMSCNAVGSSYVLCSGGTCYTSTGPAPGNQTGTCKAAVADGSACDIVVGPPCLNPARCVVANGQTQGVCVFVDSATCG